ncbi:uncharacterized protein TRUGW13939_11711 [Talaromyces rugulosus]|uniref:Uncharacterized protein n=1 Tax=Talaromyces rugulosus TaxID=121627 RepID=A0A7H8RE49_TALRU|nr:uncharacterized protein TRUGW13939_11711 [Talaromyces rugulosus]QKX64536.1 hypothetical protein TRUGW13939_11711 [Talaromyces rugulosus]
MFLTLASWFPFVALWSFSALWVLFLIRPCAGRTVDVGRHVPFSGCPCPACRTLYSRPPVTPCLSRTAIPSFDHPQLRSCLPLPCKSPSKRRVAIPLPPVPSSSLRLDERRAARDARPRPWSDRSTWAPAKPRSVRPSAAELAAASLCPRRLFKGDPLFEARRRARQERDRPWARPGPASAPPRLQSSTSSPAALSSAAAPDVSCAPELRRAPQHLRGILKPSRPACQAIKPAKKAVVWAENTTVVEVSRWIKECEDDDEVYEHMCF